MGGIQAFVGLDVHKRSVVIAVARRSGEEPVVVATVPSELSAVVKVLDRIGPRDALSCAYEAGPTGYGLYRDLRRMRIECFVVAPSLVPKKAGDRIKTDARDALTLAKSLRNNDLVSVLVPDPETEAIRDLERARRDAARALLVAKQQLGAFLLRHDRHFSGKSHWTYDHFEWFNRQKFEHPAHESLFADALHAVMAGRERVAALDRALEAVVKQWHRYPLVQALQALRGVKLLTATTLVAELIDFDRFATPRKLMAFVGMIPGERSSGERTVRTSITRTGNSSVRRIITEAAQAYRARARMTRTIVARSRHLAEGVKAIAWKAQQRLHRRLYALLARRMNANKAIIAVGRELLGFVWAIAHEKQLLAAPHSIAITTTGGRGHLN